MESAAQRAVRRRRRRTFGEAAERYERYRPGYPGALVDALVATAHLDPGAAVLEVGCGTGQLTRLLAQRALAVTALDVSQHMVEAARRRTDGDTVAFRAQSFEESTLCAQSFDLVVSADAFHWVDPEVRYAKAHDVLRPGGWLAVIVCDDRYEEPLQSAVGAMWIDRCEDGGAWARGMAPTAAEEMAASGRFGAVVELSFEWARVLSPDAVVGLECTRATALDWEPAARDRFAGELAARVGAVPSVRAIRRARLAMGVRLGSAGPSP